MSVSGCTVLYEMRIGDVWRQNSNGGGGVACLLWAEAELLGRVGMAHSIDGRRAAVPCRCRGVNQVAIDGLIIPSLRGRPPIPHPPPPWFVGVCSTRRLRCVSPTPNPLAFAFPAGWSAGRRGQGAKSTQRRSAPFRGFGGGRQPRIEAREPMRHASKQQAAPARRRRVLGSAALQPGRTGTDTLPGFASRSSMGFLYSLE